MSDKNIGADCLLKLRQASMCEASLAKGAQLSTTTQDYESYRRFQKVVESLPGVGLLIRFVSHTGNTEPRALAPRSCLPNPFTPPLNL